jgi:type III restriction enzyme
MELKTYQQNVVDDFTFFLDCFDKKEEPRSAFDCFWKEKYRIDITHAKGAIKPYNKTLGNIPAVCFKVPTAGGKTLIGIHALGAYFDHYRLDTKIVAWLVPSLTIMDQTLSNFRNSEHPYNQKLQTLFQNRFQVLSKEEALQGSSFNPEAARSMVNIILLSFDSFRTQNKEGRKVYQENGSLINFEREYKISSQIENADTTSLAQIINNLNPLVIIDESHNAVSDLSIDMLKNLNHRFILELTATPKERSNIISFVSPLLLKKENMVKLPVIVYNNHNLNDVLINAIALRNNLEKLAKDEDAENGHYIRPIVLFQAEPKTSEAATTFGKLKDKLVQFNIPPEQIAIKTADINDIKNISLNDKSCPIRYIITVNALKEGWDCPFAYILATIANRSSPTDVEQILGRILRQPYVRKHKAVMLNTSYVLASSDHFKTTIDKIIAGLNRAGFSDEDYRAAEAKQREKEKQPAQEDENLFETIDKLKLPLSTMADTGTNNFTEEIKEITEKLNAELAENIKEIENDFSLASSGMIAPEIRENKNMVRIRPQYEKIIGKIRLPRFYINESAGLFDGEEGGKKALAVENLLEGFSLSKQAADISVSNYDYDLGKIDIDENWEVHSPTPQYRKLQEKETDAFLSYLNQLSPESQREMIIARVMDYLKSLNHVETKDLKSFVNRIIENCSTRELETIRQNPYVFANKIKTKIEELTKNYAHKKFDEGIASGIIFTEDRWQFKKAIDLDPYNTLFSASPTSLYEKEENMNEFEWKVITSIAGLPNTQFWHRNMSRSGFSLNGWINHYPDFIIYTKSEKLILLETKGDDRDNSDSAHKIKLGQSWERLLGQNYKYFMVFNEAKLDSAFTLDEFLGSSDFLVEISKKV